MSEIIAVALRRGGRRRVPPPAIVNAVVDALSPLGIRHVDMPLTAAKIWRAIRR